MRKILAVLVMTLVLLGLLTGVAQAQEGNPESATASTGQIALLLTPLVAAAAAIERMIELIFDWFEGTIMNVSKLPAQASDYLTWARKQVETYQNELLLAGPDLAKVREAEDKLLKARDRLTAYLSSPPYTLWKRRLALILGLTMGLIIAFAARLQMFQLLGIPMPGYLAYVDMFITGLVIGTGSAPVHSLIGILQNTRDAIDGARALWKGKATAEVQELVRLMAELQTASPYPVSAAPAGVRPIADLQPSAAAAPSQTEAPSGPNQAEIQRLVERLLR